jgi:hypothetical protein
VKTKEVRKFTMFDARALKAQGEEPREKILAAAAAVGPNEGLAVISPFLPSPLIEKLQAEGFTARPERLHDGSWQTLFWRE